MEVSIVIVNYNTPDLTRKLIESITEKTKSCSYEVIVVDNASDVDLGETLGDFGKIKLIRNLENMGFAGGVNAGIKDAEGDYVLLVNSDVILKNDAISLIYHYLKDNPQVAVATAKLEYPDGRLQHVCQRFPSIKYLAIELFRVQKLWSKRKRGEVLLGAFFDHQTATYSDWVWATFFMFNRQLLNQLPDSKLPDDFFMYYEDVQWCKEFSQLGYKVAYRPEAEVIHHMEGSGGPKKELIRINEKAFLRKYYGYWERTLIIWLNKLLYLTIRHQMN